LIGKSLNAHVVIYPKGKYQDLLERLNVDLKQVFIVSKLEVSTEGEGSFKTQDLSVDVQPAEGKTCSRCWLVVDDVDHDGLCPRCHGIVNEPQS